MIQDNSAIVEEVLGAAPARGWPAELPLSDGLLFLTNIRSFQQMSEEEAKELKAMIAYAKLRLKGKPFQVRDKPPKFCKSYQLALIKVMGGEVTDITFSNIPCNSWTCPACNFTKAVKTKYLLRDVILMNELNYFLTLTLDPKRVPAEYLGAGYNHTHAYVTKLFNHFLTVLKRKRFRYFDKRTSSWRYMDLNSQEEKLKYVWVCEFQKKGNAHLHILLNLYLPIDVVREVWTHVGGGHMMKVEKVKRPYGVAMYLSDYIVKGLKHDYGDRGANSFKHFERRYSISMSCERPKKVTRSLLSDVNIPVEKQREWMRSVGIDWINDEFEKLKQLESAS